MTGELGGEGYLWLSPFLLVSCIYFWIKTKNNNKIHAKRWYARAKSNPAFAAWIFVSVLILVGGLINPPTNYDGLTYRIPKILYWLQEKRWHWIESIDFRLNITGAGIEWMTTPLFLATYSDRAFFLLNFIPYLLLPGLFYVAARGLGVKNKSAYWWMWVWPMAFGIVQQAASIGNDMLAGALGLASLAYAAQALRSRPILCLTFSALAVCCMTAIKATALPLCLPIALFWIWIGIKTIKPARLLQLGFAVAPIALMASFVPMAVLCWLNTGRWNGNPNDQYGFEPKNPLAGLIGNSIEFSTSLIQPPVLPMSQKISEAIIGTVKNQDWYIWTKKNYACFNPSLSPELPSEESAGIGIGITIVAIYFAFMTYRRSRREKKASNLARYFTYAVLIAITAFMMKSGVGGTRRLMIPFTPLMLLVVAYRNNITSQDYRKKAWSILPALFVIPSLLLNPNRPLLPLSEIAKISILPRNICNRVVTIEKTYKIRPNAFVQLLDKIPPGETIAYGGGDHPLTGMFKPYTCKRKIVELTNSDIIRTDWVVATRDGIERRTKISMEEWLRRNKLRITYETNMVMRVGSNQETWYIISNKLE